MQSVNYGKVSATRGAAGIVGAVWENGVAEIKKCGNNGHIESRDEGANVGNFYTMLNKEEGTVTCDVTSENNTIDSNPSNADA